MSLHNLVLAICISVLFISSVSGLKCYVCDSILGGDDCDDSADRPGKLQVCPQDRNAGCYMSEVIAGDGAVVSKGCTALANEDEYKCEVNTVGGHALTFCNCHGEGCNKDWGTAAGPKIKCYVCDSTHEDEQCDDNYPGQLKECPIESRKGCFVSKATYGDSTAYERGCSEVSDPSLFVCKDVTHNNVVRETWKTHNFASIIIHPGASILQLPW